MRIRTIKPEFWRNRKLAALGREVHGFAARLIGASDDEGYFEADPALVASDVLPFDADAQAFIKKTMPELERIGFVEFYGGGEGGIARLPKFTEHQRINRPTASRLKAKKLQRLSFIELTEPSLSPHPQLSPEEEREQGGGTGIREVENGASAASTPPPKVSPPVPLPTPTVDRFASGQDFWSHVQHRRRDLGHVTEKPPKKNLSHWWSEVGLELNGRYELLDAALGRFGANKHWATSNPPWPFDAFISTWRDYVRPAAG